MSIATQIQRLQFAKEDIKTAIENKGVSVGDGLINTYADKIRQIELGIIPTGGIEITENGIYDVTDKATAMVNVEGAGSKYPIIEGIGKHEVRFIDFDGTVLKIQYVNDNENATPPELPEHELLTFIGWNNTGYLDVTRDEDVGASYTTTDGKTHIWHFVNEENGFTKQLVFKVTATGTGVVDWGDGKTTNIISGTGTKSYNHTYTEGNYKITISHSGQFTLGASSQSSSLFGDALENPNINSGITKIYLGNSCIGLNVYSLIRVTNLEVISVGEAKTFYSNAIIGAYKLNCFVGKPASGGTISAPILECSKITYLPIWDNFNVSSGITRYANTEKLIYPKTNAVTSGYGYSAYFNTSVRKIILPEVVTSISAYFCYYASSLEEMIFPEGITTIGNYATYQCRTIKKIVLPSTLTSIGNYAFTGCTYLIDIYVYAKTPPTLGGTGCFSQTNSYFKIHVPADSLEAYKTATNWSAQASKMVGDL